MTSNKDILFTWYIYAPAGYTSVNRRYWTYLIDKNGNVLSSIENSTTNPNIKINTYSPYLLLQPIMYDDGTYLYNGGDNTRTNKTTLSTESYDNDYMHYMSVDFTYCMNKDRTVVYSWPDNQQLDVKQNIPNHIIYFPETSMAYTNGITKVDGEFIDRGANNNAVINNIYSWELADMSNYDLLLIGPSCANGNAYTNQYKYACSDKYKQSGDSPITQEEYDTAIDTASEILGEEV
jgi:hypothetical protein